MEDEQSKQEEQTEDVEAHHWKPSPTEDPGMRGQSEEEDEDVEAHHWKAGPTERLIGGSESRS